MTDTEKLKLLRKFIAENITVCKPHECQGLTARDEWELVTESVKMLRKTRPNKTKGEAKNA